MKMQIKEFYLIECPDTVLILKDIEDCISTDGNIIPIVWFCQGLFGVVRIETIKNMIQQVEDLKKMEEDDSIITIKINWDETTKVDAAILTLLI